MKRTTVIKREQLEYKWQFMDASGQILGRFATEVARYLMGKHKPIYSTNVNVGDKVVVTNAKDIAVTGKKLSNKIYYRHSGYPGGLKSVSLEKMMEKSPDLVIIKAVKGMLPKNKLRKKRMANLYVYIGSDHPHKSWETKE